MRVVIAEDLALLRDGLTRMLEDNGFEVVAGVEDGDGLIEAVERERPDVCVVDVRLPPTFRDEGIRAALEARRRVPGLPVLVLSQYVERVFAKELLADGSGGVGYLLKDRVAEIGDFVDAVRRVAAGGTAMDPEVVAQLVAGRGPARLEELTPRERDVLGLMAEGRSNQAIAAKLVVTEGAVEKHVSNIFGKLMLPPSEGDHRRVLAVLAWLGSESRRARRLPAHVVPLHHAVAARQLDAAGQRAGERPERLAVVAAQDLQVVALRALGLGAEAQRCAVLAERHAVEVAGEADGPDLAREAADPDRALARRREVVDAGDEVPAEPPARRSTCPTPAAQRHVVARAW